MTKAQRGPRQELVPIDVHSTDAAIGRAKARLRSGEAGIPKDVADAILDFFDAREAAVSRQRALSYLEKLRSAYLRLGKELLVPTSQTPKHFMAAYKDTEVWTQLTVRGVLYRFWTWLFAQKDEPFPAWLRIDISKKNANGKDHGDILSREQVASLAEHAGNSRDRALIWTLYESGARVAEVLGLRVRDVEKTEYGALRLYLPKGKTGKRTVVVFEAAVPALLLWLSAHPKREDPTAPLWPGVQQDTEVISYNMVRKVLLDAARRAGITARVNPHNFRHSRASVLAQDPGISTSILEKTMGWAPGSSMAKTYVHISGRETEEALARAHGIEIGKAAKPQTKLPVVCARDGTANDPDAAFCLRCGGPLRVEAALELEQREGKYERLAELLDDPTVKRVLAKRLEVLMRTKRAPTATT
jgi:integrase